MTKLSTQPYKGTRDFYPQDMAIRQWIFDRVRKTLKSFGYEEYDGPMLEPFELYAAKTSEEIVNEQLYWLVDRGERKLAIRPEMTPTLARMVAAKQNELPKPIRWFSIPNLWRYERPQRGRLREHWQLNVDVFGGDALAEEIEICQVIEALMRSFGATTQYEVRLNHRGLTDYLFRTILKLPEEKIAGVGRLLDGAHKMPREAFVEALAKEGVSSEASAILVDLLSVEGARKHEALLAACAPYAYLRDLLAKLTALGHGARFRLDPSIMRGFMYYTGTVLEVYDLHPENNRAMFGGGRYDNLVGLFGGQALPGIGFGMGDVTLRNFLETHKLLPDFTLSQGVYIAHMDDSLFGEAQKISAIFREEFLKRGCEEPVLSALSADKPKKVFTTAERLRAKAVVFIGSNEVQSGNFSLKYIQGEKNGQVVQGTASELAQKF